MTAPEPAFTEPASLMSTLRGAVIVGGDYSEENGMHFELEDGRILIFYGSFIVSVVRMQEAKLH